MATDNISERDDITGLTGQLNSLKSGGASALRQLELATEKCGQSLRDSSDRYEQLLTKYIALKKDYDEVKTGGEGVGGEGSIDPYVVVLVDAHSHKFKGDLVRGTTNGGSQAAKLLKDAVAQYLSEAVPNGKDCRIVVRVYANLKGLSTDAIKAKV